MIKLIFILLQLLYVILVFSGCTAKLTEPEIDFKPPKYVEEMPSREDKQDFASTGSIFASSSHLLFSDRKAMNVGDIVTVDISETAQSSSKGAKQLSEAQLSTLGGGTFATTAGNTAIQSHMNKLTGLLDMNFQNKSDSTYKGQGSASKDTSFTTTITARIVKVLKNGNYFIMGRRDLLIDNQKQIIQISGIISPYDINQKNTILSSQISDAKILYKTEGDIDRATKQGWGTKIIQAIWPF